MDKKHAERLGRWLRAKRQEAGLSTIQLGKRAGMSDTTIVRFEQGVFSAPAPDKLARIADVLGIELADVYAMADYAVPENLPSFHPYLRTKYRGMPQEAIEDLDKAFARIAKKHGYDASGPREGEDEQP
jgi:transcriptional regulator with XRE-family HTH domain